MEWAVEREVLTYDCYPVSLICRITTGFHIVRLEFNTCFTTEKVSSKIVLFVSNFFSFQLDSVNPGFFPLSEYQ